MSDMNSPQKNEELSNRLVDRLLKHYRSDRIWRNIRCLVWVALLVFYATLLQSKSTDTDTVKISQGPHVALIRLNGIIMPGQAFSAKNVLPALRAAFGDKHARGVVLAINSPGGSPVQSDLIYHEIMALKQKTHKKVIVVAADALASGAYYVASAADEIYVNGSSITGSIGVMMSGFGVTGLMNKVGIERRALMSGENKMRLDPFSPLKPEDVTKVQSVLDSVHQQFIQAVMKGRGKRLHAPAKVLFSGDFWSGKTAVKLGLADAVMMPWDALQKNFATTRVVDFTHKEDFFTHLFGSVQSHVHLQLPSHQLMAKLP